MVELLEAVRPKLARSFQTTFVAIKVSPDLVVAWQRLGDSDWSLANGAFGEVLHSTAFGPERSFTGRTNALPDHRRLTQRGTVAVHPGALLVIGSDGFFGAFSGHPALISWCETRRPGDDVPDLHESLQRSTGDDDISAVIVRNPRGSDTVIDEWLRSGAAVTLFEAIGLRPRVHPAFDQPTPIAISRGQATNYVLEDSSHRTWYLKRFHSDKRPSSDYSEGLSRLVPRHSEFASGWQRHVVTGHQLQLHSGSAPAELGAWLVGSVIAPNAAGIPWQDWFDDLRANKISTGERTAVAQDLCRQVAILEASRISHRDLSGGNVLVQGKATSLIDWDTMFHEELPYQSNTTVGSSGYMAPWVADDPHRSWRNGADRFAMAIMVAEALAVGPKPNHAVTERSFARRTWKRFRRPMRCCDGSGPCIRRPGHP